MPSDPHEGRQAQWNLKLATLGTWVVYGKIGLSLPSIIWHVIPTPPCLNDETVRAPCEKLSDECTWCSNNQWTSSYHCTKWQWAHKVAMLPEACSVSAMFEGFIASRHSRLTLTRSLSWYRVNLNWSDHSTSFHGSSQSFCHFANWSHFSYLLH